jgi:hypothetical protein
VRQLNPSMEFVTRLWWRAGWMPTAVFLLHVVISRVLNGYILFPPLDIPMHFLGGVAIAFFFSRCTALVPARVISGSARHVAEAVVVFGLTGTATVLWEFAEFFSDRLFGTRAQLGLEDTLLDMALGLAGGLAYLASAHLRATLGVPAPPLTARSA